MNDPGTLNETTVIGLGNPLIGDDGLGLAALARLREEWELPPGVKLVDGGTWGMNLLPVIEQSDRLILLDAIDVGAPPGALVTLERRELPLLLTMKVSPHQVDLRDVLALAEFRGRLPADTVALGIQPGSVGLAGELSAPVRQALDTLIRRIVQRLESWGHSCRPRSHVHA
ncbi:MAG: HyaD/HybD family hydrogenase maturation endopeptidase [Gemmatimonadetes bacterium]|nr:HyaD/HybD family hydrogenase maturation endopeptidase [Gemmatimonadota bacterium]